MNFKITFELDGCGVYYDQYEPLHLDALLAYSLAPMQCKNSNLQRDDIPFDVQIPLLRSKVNGHRVWHGSALFVDAKVVDTLRFWRKKFRQSRVSLAKGSPNLTSGRYREYNTPVPLLLVKKLYAYASGNRKEVVKVLRRNVRSLGKKRAYGYGKVVNITAEKVEKDYALSAEGVAMRWLPDKRGQKIVRASPPYWHPLDRVKCLDVGDPVDQIL